MSAARNAMLEARYYHKQESTYEEVCARTAGTWSTTSEQQQALYEMMVDDLALPNTPAIANAGRSAGYQMGSACFVLGIEDSVAGIMGTVADAAQVQKAGGGTGFDFSAIRPKGSTISSTNREAPGPVHFMKQYSMNADYISQGGLRNQANMGILRCDHPDVMDFIGAKRSNGDIANFNISVAATDDFMYRTGVGGGLSNQYPGGFDEHDVWRAIVDCAWECADPGLFFIDRANAKRLHPELYCATNPCGEVPLLDREACVLGSVNLGQHVYWQGDALLVDWEKLGRTTRLMTRMLDNIIDLQDYPLEEIKRTHQRYRKIGVGCMGWADLLTLMSMRYGSSASLALAEEVQLFMRITEYDESRRMADELGPEPR
jgi:ribonucleoside-diphosphate reductase alpha chain